jgi:hypothetical protein
MSEQVDTQATEVKEEVKTNGAGQEAAAPDLTINDLQALKTIIDVSCQRGTFRANEMASVGQVYNRLNSFLDHVAPAKETTTEKV